MRKKWFLLLFPIFFVSASFIYAGNFEFGGWWKLGIETKVDSWWITDNTGKVLEKLPVYIFTRGNGKPYFEGGLNAYTSVADGVEIWASIGEKFYEAVFRQDNRAIVDEMFPMFYSGGINIRKGGAQGYEVKFNYNSGDYWLQEPLLSVIGSHGNDEMKVNITYNFWGGILPLGLSLKGFLQDSKNDNRNYQGSVNETTLGFRTYRGFSIFGNPLNIGLTFGYMAKRKSDEDSQTYYNTLTNAGVPEEDAVKRIIAENWMNGTYNVLAGDISYNISFGGASLYIAGELGRSYTSEQRDRELNWLIGNTNSLIFKVVAKASLPIKPTTTLDLGTLSLDASVYEVQDNYKNYLGGNTPNWYEEAFQITYQFPVKFIDYSFRLAHSHPFSGTYKGFHFWEWQFDQYANQKVELNNTLHIIFKGGVDFNASYVIVHGLDYTGIRDQKLSRLHVKLSFENEFAKLSPMASYFYPEREDVTMISIGGEGVLKFTDWLKLYLRYAYVQGSRDKKSVDGELSWSDIYAQLQIFPAANGRVFIEFGEGWHTDSGVVDDLDLLSGQKTQPYIRFMTEFWL